MRLPIILSLLFMGIGGPVLAKECRMPDLPPGMKVRLPPGCDEPLPAKRSKSEGRDSLNANNGFIDLGNGTQVRIGGRVRAETGFRR